MRKSLHIAYVCTDRGVPIGGTKGASAHVEELTRALVGRGADVRIIAARAAKMPGAKPGPAPVIDLGSARSTRLMRHALMSATTGSRRAVSASEAYCLLVNQALAKELDRLHRRWRIDAVYERYSLWGFAGANFARAGGIPHLLEVNAPLRLEQRRYRALENPALASTLERYLFARADYVLIPSAELRAYVVQHGARRGGVRVVPNGADPGRFSAADRAASLAANRDGRFVVGFLGTLKPWHGVEDLVRAFRHLRRRYDGYHLLIAGDGPSRPLLERTLHSYRLSGAATFSGALTHDQVPRWLARMDVGVAPYPPLTRFYFSPLKVYEYMAAGVPMVASEIGQIATVLAHGRNALLHRPGRIREMVGCIEQLRQSPVLAEKIARNAHRLLCRRFTWQHNADRVLGLIAQARARSDGAAARRGAAGGRRGS